MTAPGCRPEVPLRMNLPPNSETPTPIPPQIATHDTFDTSSSALPAGSPAALIPPQRVDDAGASQPAGAGTASATASAKVKKRGRFWKGLGLMLLLGGGASAAYLTQTKHGQQIAQDVHEGYIEPARIVWDAKQNPGQIFEQDRSDVVNILLVGRDQNYKQVYDKQGRNIAHAIDHDSPARSDTMIIVSLNRVKKTIRMVSLPRDVLVHMPENKYNVRLAKLNAAHAYGGVGLLKKTLHDELGLTIHHHAVIKFDGFMKLVDEVGGVYVDVIGALQKDGSRTSLHYKDTWAIPPLNINLKPGKQWLSGEQAHAYVRFRMDLEGDPGRIRRQQAVMRALASRLKQLSPTQIPGVMKMIREQFETDMDDSQLASAGFFAQEMGGPTKMQPITLYHSFTEKGTAKLNRRRNKALLATIFGPTFNPDNFLQNTPTVRSYEFGPDENKPDTRAILREAGLIEGEPRLATGHEASPDQMPPAPLGPNGFAAPPLGSQFIPGSSVPPNAPSAPRDPFAFTAPGAEAEPGRSVEERGSIDGSSASEPSSESSSEEERPRRRTRRSRERTEAREREPRVAEPSQSERDSSEPAAPDSEPSSPLSPVPQAEADNGDLSVESPIPQAEN